MKLTREAKQSFNEKLADKLSSSTLSSIPLLEVNNAVHTDEYDKANILNTTCKVKQYQMPLKQIK